MMLNETLKQAVESVVGLRVVKAKSIPGGCIADSYGIELANGQRFFLKSGMPSDMLQAEARGLGLLFGSRCFRVPAVECVADSFLLMEWVDHGSVSKHFFRNMGRQLAQMHRCSAATFGLDSDNFIGKSPQYNVATEKSAIDWCEFYLNNRLLPQLKMASANGYVDDELQQFFDALVMMLPDILASSEEPPALLHGDLWAGNFMADMHGNPVLFDPAVYFGHREADLAMTKLFGGFDPSFYDAYQAEWPLKPGYAYREPVYMLYHVLNHLNLFGLSYRPQVLSLLRSYQ
jgi:protein-ribulosamine 3-kinase